VEFLAERSPEIGVSSETPLLGFGNEQGPHPHSFRLTGGAAGAMLTSARHDDRLSCRRRSKIEKFRRYGLVLMVVDIGQSTSVAIGANGCHSG
jgi:hypothetical protein